MKIKKAFTSILNQLEDVLSQVNDVELTAPVGAFSGASIGEHFRHSIEFIQCLMNGYEEGRVNYDLRKRSYKLETDTLFIKEQIHQLKQFISNCDINRKLELCVNYDPNSEELICIHTNMEREMAYNIEHIIHHMALVKIGIKEICPHLEISYDFGVAISTIKHRDKLEN